MNTLLLSAITAMLAPAAPPPEPVPVGPGLESARSGKVLVLTNGGTIVGDIEHVGDRYRICREMGETWVPGDKVLCLCEGVEEAYTVLRGRVKMEDLEGRIRLAEWCRDHGMNQIALGEARALAARNREHPQVRRLLTVLDPQTPSAREPVVPVVLLPQPPPPPRIDLTSEAIIQFGTRVQPILMNTCVSCHNETRGTTFRLTRTYEAGIANRAILHQNLSAVLSYINVEKPLASPFLSHALTVHWLKKMPAAQGPAPFKNSSATAYRTLEDWVRLAMSSVTPAEEAPAPPPFPSAPLARTVPVAPSTAPAAPARPVEVTRIPPPDPRTPEQATVRPTPFPTVPPPRDVCDADEFNQQHHPDRVKKDGETR